MDDSATRITIAAGCIRTERRFVLQCIEDSYVEMLGSQVWTGFRIENEEKFKKLLSKYANYFQTSNMKFYLLYLISVLLLLVPLG